MTDTLPTVVLPTAGQATRRLYDIPVEIRRHALSAAFAVGSLLAEARDLHKYAGYRGGFRAWCKDNLDFTERQADRFILVFETYGEKSDIYVGHSMNALIELSSAPASVSQEIEAAITETGKTFTAAEIKQIKTEHAQSIKKAVDFATGEAEGKLREATAEIERLRLLVDESATGQSVAEKDKAEIGKRLKKAEDAKAKAVEALAKLKAEAKATQPKLDPLDAAIDRLIVLLLPYQFPEEAEDKILDVADRMRRRMIPTQGETTDD